MATMHRCTIICREQPVGEMELAAEVFEAAAERAADAPGRGGRAGERRQGTHNTKTRGEVTGGGRKP